MKDKISVVLAFLFIFAGLISCEKDKPPISGYPIEIPFTEYILTGDSCNWTNIEFDEVNVINSNIQLQDYIECIGSNYPTINFSNYSLLRVKGMATNSPVKVLEIQLTQTMENTYSLYVKVGKGMATTPAFWNISITTQKLPENAVITLNVEQIYI